MKQITKDIQELKKKIATTKRNLGEEKQRFEFNSYKKSTK